MAKLQVYAVYDSKVKAFMHPFFMRTKGEAIRGWIDAVNDNTTAFYKHPEDYTLMELGEYDEDTGKFNNANTPSSCGIALEYVRTQEKMQNLDTPSGSPVAPMQKRKTL